MQEGIVPLQPTLHSFLKVGIGLSVVVFVLFAMFFNPSYIAILSALRALAGLPGQAPKIGRNTLQRISDMRQSFVGNPATLDPIEISIELEASTSTCLDT
jgi:hypothetical protein